MKALIWIIILFAVAVGIAMASSIYTGNVYVVLEQYQIRVNLHAFVLGLLALVGVLYLLVQLLASILNVPGRMQRFGLRRQERKATGSLNAAGLAFFEGKFQKAEQEAAKVLANKEAGDNRALALMLGANAADQMDDIELRDRYLQDVSKLPEKNQLSRHLLLAESALSRRDYTVVEQEIQAASRINPGLTRLVRLKLRYAFDHGDALEVLNMTAKLLKAGAINEYEANEYRLWAYRRLIALASDQSSFKACLKRIPEDLRIGQLCVVIADKYEHLGLYPQAVAWVSKYYPLTQQTELLPVFVQSVGYLGEKEQRKAIDTAEVWLQKRPEDAQLLNYLGLLSYSNKLWGKAQGYLEASLAVEPSMQARLGLAKVFDETDQTKKAEEQRKLALANIEQEEELNLPVVQP